MGGVLLNGILLVILYRNEFDWMTFLIFQVTQATVLQFWTPSCLRGYGVGTPNGALWTIGIMVQCYLVMWFLYRYLKGKDNYCWGITLGVGIGCNIGFPLLQPYLPTILFKLVMQTFFPYIWLFVLGAFMSKYFDEIIVWLKKYWFIFLVASTFFDLFGIDMGRYGTLKSMCLAFAVIGFAYLFIQCKISVDISYGIYIYHMIIINLMIYFDIMGEWRHLFLALFATILSALLSYQIIGKNSARKKAKLT